eukprot:gb/GECG01003066.1/.p1 GENE.gb/GECG01003066.1/~~gb/GECG01003066.1/.p1  ORF type:complete len:216 (+),score=31.00 gb/GECG01003066.1/:1-648(+)
MSTTVDLVEGDGPHNGAPSALPSSSSSGSAFYSASASTNGGNQYASASAAGGAKSDADSNSFCRQRLRQERKQWKRDHPVGFVAKPRSKPDGSVDLMTWDCKIPGKPNTPWEGASYNLVMIFDEEFPAKPPKCVFKPVLFHPNVYPSGTVCLSILSEAGWSPSLNVRAILEGIQELLDNPNLGDPAQAEPFRMCRDDPVRYKEKVRELAQRYSRG